jgi:hypothetical protein
LAGGRGGSSVKIEPNCASAGLAALIAAIARMQTDSLDRAMNPDRPP